MQFNKLRLTGFKSFVDNSELLIEKGITGVVGPNGCGKSNVIESLRWVMGETSAKRMRGKEMDDVIFGGSANRPARNIAEVTITLDNSDRTAPAAFNDQDEVDITRRIERGHGSNYRINGKEVRARDVQLLFADLASGANSTAIVSQGRIGAIIGAKPTERRTLLEEAAGIRGLHSRRHEAELRLRAADTNLERLEDVIGALEVQNQSLQKQARQANRYRRLSEHIRRNEAILLHLKWQEAGIDLTASATALAAAETLVATKAGLAASGASSQANASSILPELRHKEAEVAAELQRLMLAERELANEEARVASSKQEVASRLEQIKGDIAREQSLADDAVAALSRLVEEREHLTEHFGEEQAAVEEMQSTLEDTRLEVLDGEATLNQLTEEVAGLEARRTAAARQLEEVNARNDQLQARAEALAVERNSLAQDIAAVEDLDQAEQFVVTSEAVLEEAKSLSEEAGEKESLTQQAERDARDQLSFVENGARVELEAAQDNGRHVYAEIEADTREKLKVAESGLAALQAEERALSQLVEYSAVALTNPLIDKLKVTAGYEAALGAALGDDLEASTDETSPVYWHMLPPISKNNKLPNDVEMLSDFVKAPDALTRRLTQVGVVKSAAEGQRLQAELALGQRLVSREGGLWRWDGFVISEGAQTSAATRLEQRNRLFDLRKELKAAKTKAEKEVIDAERTLAKTKTDEAARIHEIQTRTDSEVEAVQMLFADTVEAASISADRARDLRMKYQEAFDVLNEARQTHASLSSRAAAARSRVVALEENAERITADMEETQSQLQSLEQHLKGMEDPASAWDRVNQLRANLAELRSVQIEKQTAFDRIHREAEQRQVRLSAIEVDENSWNERAAGAHGRMDDLCKRSEDGVEEQLRLEARPIEIEEQRLSLLELIAEAETRRRHAADALATAERTQSEADRELKEAEAALAEAREERIRKQAICEQAQLAADVIAERIQEKLDCYPNDALKAGGVEEGDMLPAKDDASSKFERLVRERENMGAVNLRAEQEAAELAQQVESMNNEREDLLEAIARLRQGINALNREGRERLLKAFDEVNAHFQELFVKLFGGGRAELALTEADDPLQAGLEIMASPPGKRMQVMSLLSGGEQALTALALLFAVFLTNPAPICVLDEVDAPLDDANVDRFCAMLEEMSKEGNTRFLVVTHHRMTMARVDRLFGVTMAERGVSQLVSVDLRQAAAMQDVV